MGSEFVKKRVSLSVEGFSGFWQRWGVALRGWWGWRGLSWGRYVGDSVSAPQQ